MQLAWLDDVTFVMHTLVKALVHNRHPVEGRKKIIVVTDTDLASEASDAIPIVSPAR